MKAKKFDTNFESGVDVTAALDLSKARRPLQEQKRVNVDFPNWMVESLDREASRLGVTRQSIIKLWLAERLEQLASNNRVESDA
ncbi:MAG: CopG family transcriptional regulator [Nitrospiraceae bacterium]